MFLGKLKSFFSQLIVVSRGFLVATQLLNHIPTLSSHLIVRFEMVLHTLLKIDFLRSYFANRFNDLRLQLLRILFRSHIFREDVCSPANFDNTQDSSQSDASDFNNLLALYLHLDNVNNLLLFKLQNIFFATAYNFFSYNRSQAITCILRRLYLNDIFCPEIGKFFRYVIRPFSPMFACFSSRNFSFGHMSPPIFV